MARRTVSRDVGRNGCLRDDIFTGVEVVVVEIEGVDSGGSFWTLCERRGVADPESIILDAEGKDLKVYNMRQSSPEHAGNKLMWRTDGEVCRKEAEILGTRVLICRPCLPMTLDAELPCLTAINPRGDGPPRRNLPATASEL